MNPDIVTPPTAEPISLAEAKGHLKIDHADEDAYIAALIVQARVAAENFTGKAFIKRTLDWRFDGWPTCPPIATGPFGAPSTAVRVPTGPLLAVNAIGVTDAAGVETILDAQTYGLDIQGGRIFRVPGSSWPDPGQPIAGIRIDYDAGFGEDWNAVPETIRRAVLELVANLYANRGDPAVQAGAGMAASPGARALLMPYRTLRLVS